MNKRILIFSGGNLGQWALDEIEPGDYLVGVDKGTMFLLHHHLTPDYALGDFDSVTDEELAKIKSASREVAAYDPVDKDYTDTELSFNWAIQQKPKEILLLGVLGSRFDHVLANVQLLVKANQGAIPCRIIDETNEIRLTDRNIKVTKGRFKYLSILPMTPSVRGVTLKGMQYPLQDATLTQGQSIGISNIVLADAGEICLKEGLLLIIKSID